MKQYKALDPKKTLSSFEILAIFQGPFQKSTTSSSSVSYDPFLLWTPIVFYVCYVSLEQNFHLQMNWVLFIQIIQVIQLSTVDSGQTSLDNGQ